MRRASKVQFADERLKKAFEELKQSGKVKSDLYRWLERAFKDIEDNAFCGIQIPKRLIPRDYVKKYNVKNLWKYNLPGAWRLLYSIEANEVTIISIVLRWVDHKHYERLFKY